MSCGEDFCKILMKFYLIFFLVINQNAIASANNFNDSVARKFASLPKLKQNLSSNFQQCQANDEECCEDLLQSFKIFWMKGKRRLTQLLEQLQAANCSAFTSECERRTFSYNDFTNLVYDRFCAEDIFNDACAKGKKKFFLSNLPISYLKKIEIQNSTLVG